MSDCRGTFSYGVIAPSHAWEYAIQQLEYLIFSGILAFGLVSLLLRLKPAWLHPQTLQQPCGGSFHLGLLLMFAGGLSYRVSFHRREAYADVVSCRQALIRDGHPHDDIFTWAYYGMDKLFRVAFVVLVIVAGFLVLSVLWYLLQTAREHITGGQAGCKNILSIVRQRVLGIPPEQSWLSVVTAYPETFSIAINMVPIIITNAYISANLRPRYWARCFPIITSVKLSWWVHKSSIQRLDSGPFRRLVSFALFLCMVTPSWTLFWPFYKPPFMELMGLVAFSHGVVRVAAEFMPSSVGIELPWKESRVEDKREAMVVKDPTPNKVTRVTEIMDV